MNHMHIYYKNEIAAPVRTYFIFWYFRYFYTHDYPDDITQTHPLSFSDFEILKKRQLRDILCDNMKDVMPMVVQNPYFTHSDNNPLLDCNVISTMRTRDLALFNGEDSVNALPIDSKKGKRIPIIRFCIAFHFYVVKYAIWSSHG